MAINVAFVVNCWRWWLNIHSICALMEGWRSLAQCHFVISCGLPKLWKINNKKEKNRCIFRFFFWGSIKEDFNFVTATTNGLSNSKHILYVNWKFINESGQISSRCDISEEAEEEIPFFDPNKEYLSLIDDTTSRKSLLKQFRSSWALFWPIQG